MKKLLIAALAAACVCASTAVSFAGSAPPVPAATVAAPSPAPTPSLAPRVDLRTANNPVKRRQIEDVKLLPKRKAAAAKLCADHGFGPLYGFTRDEADGGWLVACNPKSGKPTSARELPMLLVDSLP